MDSDGRAFVSDGGSEFVECCDKAKVSMAGFGPNFVAAAAQVLNEGVVPDHDRRCSVGLESTHRSEPRLESAVFALDAVIGVLLGVVERVWDQLLDHGFQRLSEISDDLVWFAVSVERTTEERLGRCDIAPG